MRVRGLPMFFQYPSAIFSATSTDVEPLSEKKTWPKPGGASAINPRATASAGSCVKPAKIT